MNIAINGAGIAGLTLAYWLKYYGHEPVLIEKAPTLRTGGYIVDFWGVGYTVAERMGILPDVRRAGYNVQELRLVDDRGCTVAAIPTDALRLTLQDRFTSLPRGDLADTIYRSIEGRVELLFGNSIATLEEHRAGVHVGFEHGPGRDFDLVIGADGLHSRVRELWFGPERQFEHQLGYRVAVFEAPGYRPRDELVYISHTKPGRQMARFTLRGDRTLFLFVFRGERMASPEPRDAEERKAILHQVFADGGWECGPILAALDHAQDVYLDRVSQIRMASWSKGRIMLIGDAAACVSLMAGEGAGLAMAEAYVLAGELRRSVGDYREAFCRQEQRLRQFVEEKQDSARRFAAAFAPRTRVGVWFRNQVAKLLVVPPIARYFLGRELRDNIQLPQYETASCCS